MPNISGSKCSQTIKFSQLIDSMKKVSWKSSTECGGETGGREIFEKLKSNISPDQ